MCIHRHTFYIHGSYIARHNPLILQHPTFTVGVKPLKPISSSLSQSLEPNLRTLENHFYLRTKQISRNKNFSSTMINSPEASSNQNFQQCELAAPKTGANGNIVRRDGPTSTRRNNGGVLSQSSSRDSACDKPSLLLLPVFPFSLAPTIIASPSSAASRISLGSALPLDTRRSSV